MVKGSIQEDITIINIYALNIGAPQYVRQMLTSSTDQLDLIDMYKTFHPKTMNFTFFLKCIWNFCHNRSHPGPQI